MFITFEGPEGCGKSTQALLLADHLKENGRAVLLTMEPGGTPLGKEIRQLLLHSEKNLEKDSELYLFAADRIEHVKKVIRPALLEDKIVICDRYTDSTLAYQVGGRNISEDLVRYLNMTSSDGLAPDITIMLDVHPEIGLKRAVKKGKADRFEKETVAFHERVRAIYLVIAKQESGRVKVINTETESIEKIQEKIREIINEKLGN